MNEEQKLKIESNIKRLDYLEGTGVLSTNKKKLVDEFFVFISAGGSGRNALERVKKTIVNQIDSSCVAKQTMFLAIDSAHNEQDRAKDAGIFTPSEIVKLPYKGAHKNINPDVILPQTKAWVHKELWAVTGGAGADVTAPPEFNGTGAGAKRQCGRVLFTQTAAQQELFQALATIKNKLATMGKTPKIKIFFLVGIAGGTGSGTIIDLAYLTRHYLKSILGVAYANVNFSAYLLLPSACGDVTDPTDRAVGNQNAYAALKEIDYYMTISNRNEHFTMDYGTAAAKNVDVAENIFDFCTLVEGIGEGGSFHLDNADTARQIIADSILNVICADREGVNNQNVFMVDSFLSNQSAKVTNKIEAQADSQWPRDNNYIYSVIGFSSCVIPIDLLTVYVAKKVFDEVFKRFRKAELATEERAAEFLKQCGLEVNQLGSAWKTLQKSQLKKDIQDQADAEFRANGPYYMVNLANEAAKLIESAPNDYAHKARSNKSGFLANGEKWSRVETLYDTAAAYLREINTTLYDVYTYSIEVLRNLIEKNAGLLTDTNEYKNTFGKSFCWSPIDLTPGDTASVAVINYLDGILSEKDVKRIAAKFVDMLCEKKDEWTGLDTDGNHGVMTFDVAKEIRTFISENFKECISTTMEEFLVKANTGRSDAPVYSYDEHGNQIPSDDTQAAADVILERLSNNAKALASVSGYSLEETYSNIYLTLPVDCKWLYQAMSDKSGTYGIHPDDIYQSTAKDRVVLCKLYTGVPAWALFWTKEAENDYETGGPNKVALHIDQGENGTNWAELPNLYPEKLWSPTDALIRTREAEISKGIRALMNRAKKVGMIIPNVVEPDYYDIYLMNGEYSAKELLEKAELNTNQKYSMEEVLNRLVSAGCATRDKVSYVNQVMTTPDRLNPSELEEFRFNMACRTMRRLHGKWDLLAKSVETFEGLIVILPEPISVDSLTTYIKALTYGLLVYDGRRGYWSINVGDETRIGDKITDKLQKQCAHYYGYQKFLSLDEDMMESLTERINELDEKSDEDDDVLDAREAAEKLLKKSLKALRDAKKPGAIWPEDTPFARDANDSEWPMSTLKFEDRAGEKAKAIRKFYDDLIANI